MLPHMKLAGTLVCLLIFLLAICSAVEAQVSSNFDGGAGADGWVASIADTYGYSTTGGNPGGYMFADPYGLVLGAGSIYYAYFAAPAKFLGNKSAYYGGTLRFDAYEPSSGGALSTMPEVIIENATGVGIYYYPTPSFRHAAPATWTTFSLRLDASTGYWKTANDPGATAATQAQIQSVLSNIQTLQVRALFRAQNIIVRLDNVILTPRINITTQPASTTVCAGSTVTLSTVASGNPAITYQWQFESSAAGWQNISNGSGYSGATTASLSIVTSASFGAGRYRCVVSGTAVESEITSIATVAVNALPTTPTATGNSSCGPGSVVLTASGGSAGQYRWYTVASGGISIAGQTGSTYTTPTLTATTQFYVAINNGTCQSARRQVTATINTPPSAPGTSGNFSCAPGPVSLSATGGSAGQYRWYTAASGGTPIPGATSSTFTTPSLTNSTTYYVSINNGTCESQRVPVEAAISPPQCSNEPPTIATTPLATHIDGVITIALSDLISDADDNADLSTLKIVTPPSSGAPAMIDGNFNLIVDYRGIAFSGTEHIALQVCDIFQACSEAMFAIEVAGDIVVYNAISPNGDDFNKIFYLEHIEKLEDTQSNRVTIFNRWGDVVWEGSDYDNEAVVFTGRTTSGDFLPTGVYFYRIEFMSLRPAQTGYITLRR